MTSSADGLTAHPITGFATRLHQALDGLAETAAWSMTPDEQRDALVELARAEARMEELRLRVLAAADRNDIAADSAGTSTGAWVAHATRQPRGQAHRDVTVAVALDEEFGATRDALASGAVDGEQARVIVGAIRALSRQAPDAVAADPSIPQRAEKHLVELAAEYDAVALKGLGRHVLEVLENVTRSRGARAAGTDLANGRLLCPYHHGKAHSTGYETVVLPSGQVRFHRRT